MNVFRITYSKNADEVTLYLLTLQESFCTCIHIISTAPSAQKSAPQDADSSTLSKEIFICCGLKAASPSRNKDDTYFIQCHLSVSPCAVLHMEVLSLISPLSLCCTALEFKRHLPTPPSRSGRMLHLVI